MALCAGLCTRQQAFAGFQLQQQSQGKPAPLKRQPKRRFGVWGTFLIQLLTPACGLLQGLRAHWTLWPIRPRLHPLPQRTAPVPARISGAKKLLPTTG